MKKTKIDSGYLKLSVFFVLVLFLSSCGIHKPFELVDGTKKINTGTLAVLSGGNTEAEIKLASNLTTELKEKSTFKVMSQAEIARRVPGYPSDLIRNSTVPKDEENNYAWFSKGNKGRVDAAQEKLQVNYIFVVWVGQLSKVVTSGQYGSGVDYVASVYGRLIEYPRGKVIGYSAFGESKKQSCCLFGQSEGEDVDTLLRNSAETVSDKFIKITGSEKQGK